MASLTKGISFRRQGSSGLAWADSWIITEKGVFNAKDNKPVIFGKGEGASNLQGEAGFGSPVGPLSRSKSTGSAGVGGFQRTNPNSRKSRTQPQSPASAAMADSKHKGSSSGSKILKWIKSKFKKSK